MRPPVISRPAGAEPQDGQCWISKIAFPLLPVWRENQASDFDLPACGGHQPGPKPDRFAGHGSRDLHCRPQPAGSAEMRQ